MTVILDNSRGNNTPVKSSPDNTIVEWEYTRKLVDAIHNELVSREIKTHVLVPEQYDVSLAERVRRVNDLYEADKGSFLISVHLNAASINNEWKTARGWSVFVSNSPSTDTKRLADNLYKSAADLNLECRRPNQSQNYWQQNHYICKNSQCPAVITENMFIDNRDDIRFLSSETGFKTLVNLHVEAILSYISGK